MIFMKGNYCFRKSTLNDIDLIFKLKELGLKWYIEIIYGWDDEVQRRKTEEHLKQYLDDIRIIRVDNKDVGVTAFHKNEDYYCIGLTVIHPDYQNMGIASSILSEYIECAKKDRKRIIIKTYKYNPAKRLYERLGFKVYNEDDTHVYMEIKCA